jgi:ElaB/YqjD/DUF883 family membrane-anchored ribosome-binding protein
LTKLKAGVPELPTMAGARAADCTTPSKEPPMSMTVDGLKADLKHDVRNIVNDTEQLLKAAARNGNDGLDELRARLETQLRHLRSQLGELEAGAVHQARTAARSADERVRAHPYGAIGIAAAAGLLIGFLVARR